MLGENKAPRTAVSRWQEIKPVLARPHVPVKPSPLGAQHNGTVDPRGCYNDTKKKFGYDTGNDKWETRGSVASAVCFGLGHPEATREPVGANNFHQNSSGS